MESWLYFIFALIPFVLVFFFMVGLQWRATKAMPLVYITTLLIAIFVWKMPNLILAASFVKGIFVVIEILLIVFFAILLLMILKQSRKIDLIQEFLGSISKDVRVQAILIAFCFVSLIEGASGFGTPAALAAPMLVFLGFTPVSAVIASLIGDSAAVTFGAGGAPIIIGIQTLGVAPEVVTQTIIYSALIHALVCFVVPLSVGYYINKMYCKNCKFREIIPLCLVAWLSFSIPSFLVAYFIGAEIPSVVGGIVSLLVVTFMAKRNILTPKKDVIIKKIKNHHPRTKNLLIAFAPYVFLVVSLITVRVIPPVFKFLSDIKLSIPTLFGQTINYKFVPFVSPSFYFFLTCVFAIIMFRIDFKNICLNCSTTIRKLNSPAFALIFTLGVVQLFLFSNVNRLDLLSMPGILAEYIAMAFSHFFVLVSPFIGMVGAFIAGSNTVSNLLFGSFQAETAVKLGVSVAGILALQAVGGAIGNMIAIHNILAASATVGLSGQEGFIIRKTIKPALIYASLAGLVGAVLFLIL